MKFLYVVVLIVALHLAIASCEDVPTGACFPPGKSIKTAHHYCFCQWYFMWDCHRVSIKDGNETLVT